MLTGKKLNDNASSLKKMKFKLNELISAEEEQIINHVDIPSVSNQELM